MPQATNQCLKTIYERLGTWMIYFNFVLFFSSLAFVISFSYFKLQSNEHLMSISICRGSTVLGLPESFPYISSPADQDSLLYRGLQ